MRARNGSYWSLTGMTKLAAVSNSKQPQSPPRSRGQAEGGPRPLVVAHVVEGCKGGVGTAARHLICGQALDAAIGHIHLLADPDRMGDMLADVPATVHQYQSSRAPGRMRRVAHEVQAKLRELNPDIVYLHSTFPGVYGRLRVDRQGPPWATVYCAHGWAFTQRVSMLKQKAYQWIERYLARRADAIVSISHFEYQSAVKAGIKHPMHRIIPHGIPAASANIRPVIQTAGDGLHLLFVGRFDEQKGVDLLFDAWKDPRLDAIHLWLIGDTTLETDVTIPQQPNVHSLGWIRNDQMDGYMVSFDAVIMPSRWEGFGLVALEAMRNARPVLASRAGGLPELIIDRVNGRLIDPEDREELIKVLVGLSPRELVRMGEEAFGIFSAGFEWDFCYQRWSQIAMEAWQARRTTASK